MPRFKKLQDIIAFKNATENQELRFLKADIKKQPAHWSPFMIRKKGKSRSIFVCYDFNIRHNKNKIIFIGKCYDKENVN